MKNAVIDKDTDIPGGTPVFSRTRVPMRIWMDHLEASDRLDKFLESCPTVSRVQAVEVLERAKRMLNRKQKRGLVAAGN